MWLEKSNKKLNYKKIILEKKGEQYYFIHENEIISPWHDVPYKLSNNTYLMVNEIPKWTRKKMEIQTDKKNNPIIQEINTRQSAPQSVADNEYRIL